MLATGAFLSHISLAVFAFSHTKIVKWVVGASMLAGILVAYMLSASKWEVLVDINGLLSGFIRNLEEIGKKNKY